MRLRYRLDAPRPSPRRVHSPPSPTSAVRYRLPPPTSLSPRPCPTFAAVARSERRLRRRYRIL